MEVTQKTKNSLVPAAHTYKPKYSGGLKFEASPGK
jgi:hypothetical protein